MTDWVWSITKEPQWPNSHFRGHQPDDKNPKQDFKKLGKNVLCKF